MTNPEPNQKFHPYHPNHPKVDMIRKSLDILAANRENIDESRVKEAGLEGLLFYMDVQSDIIRALVEGIDDIMTQGAVARLG